MGSKKLKTKKDKKNTINNINDNLIPTKLTKYSDNMSINFVKKKEITRCHICCINIYTEEYYDHKKKYHYTPLKNTDFSEKNTNSSTKIKVKKPRTKVIKKVTNECEYDDWKCILCPSLVVDSSTLLEHVRTYHHPTNPILPVNQISADTNFPIVLLKRDNYAAFVGKRWTRSIAEHINAVLEIQANVEEFYCDFCKAICIDPDHFEIQQWSKEDSDI